MANQSTTLSAERLQELLAIEEKAKYEESLTKQRYGAGCYLRPSKYVKGSFYGILSVPYVTDNKELVEYKDGQYDRVAVNPEMAQFEVTASPNKDGSMSLRYSKIYVPKKKTEDKVVEKTPPAKEETPDSVEF